MTPFMSRVLASVLFLSVATSSAAGERISKGEQGLGLSSTEALAFAQPSSVAFVLGVLSRCDRIRERIAEQQLLEVTHTLDAQGRVSTMRVGSTDFVVEYGTDLDTKPSAMIGLGVRVPMALVRDSDTVRSVAAIRARAVMYRKALSLCGVSSVAQSKSAWGFVLAKKWFEEETFPTEWTDSGFWEGYWEPSFGLAIARFDTMPRCVLECQDTCNNVNDVAQVGCAVTAGVVSRANAGLGILVGAACSLGALGMREVCRRDCSVKCQ